MKIKFTKMHGLGNDFVMVDGYELESLPIESIQDFARNISNRYTGLGCDQFIIYKQHENYWSMSIYNNDGSKAMACGNGTRCLARLIHTITNETNIVIKVGDKLLSCVVNSLYDISVNMGPVSFTGDWILPEDKILMLAKNYNLNPREIICADIGNPHLIIFSQGLTDDDKKLLGAKLSVVELFPEGVNVNFAQLQNNNILLQVWERGVGFTLACGSGTCASFAAACLLGYIDETKDCKVIFKLGSLSLKFNATRDVILSGPTEVVARGEYYYV